jgi:3-methyladenine DNA glycosylase AlkD
MKVEELYHEIVKQLKSRENREAATKIVAKAKYFGITIGSYGLNEPEEKEIFENYCEGLKQSNLGERLELVKKLYASGFAEEVNFGDTVLMLSLEEITPVHYSSLDEIGSHLSHWGETDWFCINILQPLLRQYPEETLELLRKWNRTQHTWKQRASVVAFTRKVGQSGKFTDEVLELCENLIWSKEDYVRKGVGWVLKDNMRGSKKKVLDYVKSLRQRGVSSVITLYAIRDLKGSERKEALGKRCQKTRKKRDF